MYYGNSSATGQENPTGVWDSNFMIVQHQNEASGTLYDATANNNDGTPVGGVTQNVTGMIDGADTFDGTDDYYTIPDAASLDIDSATGEILMETWIYPHTSGGKTGNRLFPKRR